MQIKLSLWDNFFFPQAIGGYQYRGITFLIHGHYRRNYDINIIYIFVCIIIINKEDSLLKYLIKTTVDPC